MRGGTRPLIDMRGSITSAGLPPGCSHKKRGESFGPHPALFAILSGKRLLIEIECQAGAEFLPRAELSQEEATIAADEA